MKAIRMCSCRPFFPFLILQCLLFFAVAAHAQVQTSTAVTGTVADAGGAVLPGAQIVLINQNTGAVQTAKTNADGAYSFLGILPGTYSVKASAVGFKSVEFSNRVIEVAEPAIVDFSMQVGQTTETVSVNAEGADLLDVSTAEVSGTINQHLVKSLPLNGRDFLDLTTTVPGTANTAALGVYSNNGSNQVSFTESALMGVSVAGVSLTSGVILGGNRDSSSNISIDGSNIQLAHFGEIVQLQSPSTIDSVKVESGVMNPEFGFGTGAVNTITKSGTNQFHGEAYEYLRNQIFDANNYFNNLSGLKRPVYRMNQFGASVGGPILRDKLHFFGNYEGLRISQATPINSNTPPANLRTGDFSTLGPGVTTPAPIIYNPYRFDSVTGLREPFPNNQIPLGPTTLCSPRPTCVDPAMLSYLKYTPTPTTLVSGQLYYVATTPAVVNQDQYTGRIDWDVSQRDRISGRFTHFKDNSVATNLAPIAGIENPFGSINPLVSWVRTMGSIGVNNLTVGFMRGFWANRRATQGFSNIAANLGLTNTSNGAGGPNINDADYTHASSNYSLGYILEDNLQLKEDYSLAWGRHTLKFGFQGNNRRSHFDNNSFDKGQLTFKDIYTAACPLGNTACNAARTASGLPSGGMAFADYLLGAVQESKLNLPGARYDANQNYVGAYGQDTWRISQKMTLNYGLRYDYWTPWLNVRRMAIRWDAPTGNVIYALQNPLDYLDPAKGFGRNAPLTHGENAQGYTTGGKDFSPRAGLAYLLTKNTTVHAGAGIYFDGNANLNQMSNDQSSGAGPFSLTVDNIVGGTEQAPPYLAANQFPAPSPTAIAAPNRANPLSIRALASRYYPTPTVYQWTASAQQRLGRDWVAELTYLGTHTIREMEYFDLNAPVQPLGSNATLTIQQRRHFPGWGSVGSWNNLGFAKYNAVIGSIKTPRWEGLTLMSWLSYSRDVASSELGKSDQANIDPRFVSLWAGATLLNPDLRNVNTWNYDLPVGLGKRFEPNHALNYLIGEWRVSGSAEFSQGGHQAVQLANDNSSTGQGYPLASQTCNPNNVPGGRTRLHWINTACYTVPAFGVYGKSNLGSFREPGVSNWNLAFEKGFPIPKVESNQLLLHVDLFNVFNHTQWGYVNNYWNASNPGTFGQPRAAHPARQVQFALKYEF